MDYGQARKHFVDGDEVKNKLKGLLTGADWLSVKKEDGVEVFELGDSEGFWLKIEAPFEEGDFEQLRDVLDTNLERRQKEWHELLLPGGSVIPVDESKELCYFAYSSPWPMSNRDCLYCKERSVNSESEFQLLYWTVRDDEVKAPVKGMVRIDFQAAHWVKKCDNHSCAYVYIQRSNAKVSLPDFLLKSVQVGILFGEVKGLRRAIAGAAKGE